MREYSEKNIHNICLLGHGGAGKTSVAEAMLYLSKMTDRLGKVADGTSICDYDVEEIKRKTSISLSVAPCEWNNNKVNIIDVPGYFDFEGEMISAMSVSDGAVVVLSGKSGLTVGAVKAIKALEKNNIPKIIFVSKTDSENANFYKVLDSLKEKYGVKICPLEIPIAKDNKIYGYVNLVEGKGRSYNPDGSFTYMDIPDYMNEKIDPIRNILHEAIAQTDDALMDKFFNEEEFTPDEIATALKTGVSQGDIIPVLCGSANTLCGISFLLDTVSNFFPSADYKKSVVGENSSGDAVEKIISANEKMSAYVFKTIADPFVGKMSFFRVMTGVVEKDMQALNSSRGTVEKIGRLFRVTGKKQVEVERVSAGDIGVVTKLAETKTGDTLCDPSSFIKYAPLVFPKPQYAMAIKPKAKGDEEKISAGIHKLIEEDPTFSFVNNVETKEQVIYGLGDMQVDVIVSKLKNKFGTEVTLEQPRIAYRETIRKKVKVQGKHKKQSGGHGQYGDVWIEFEPNYETEDLVFEETIYGGAVPKNYFPAVEKGLRDSIQHGVIAGYPVVNIKATLVDGSYHPVDSSEMSFKMAASAAYKAGMQEASPVLLEPVGMLKVYVPNDLTGDIIGDINKRRGRILGMNPTGEDDMQEILAEVPMGEMKDYCMSLRSVSQGRGSYEFDFEKYEELPAAFADKVISEAKIDTEK